GEPVWGWVPPRIARDLGLGRHGLEVRQPDPWVAAPLPQGGRLELSTHVGRAAEALARVSPADARRWPEFCARMHRLAGFLERLYASPPPLPTGTGPGEWLRLAGLGRRFRALGRTGMWDLLRVPPMSVWELLDDWFESDVLKGLLGAGAVTGICRGPRSGGTGFLLLHRQVGSPAGVFRPPAVGGPNGSGAEGVFARAARARGVEIRHQARVVRVVVREDRVGGVVLESGEELAAPIVLSSADPRRTFLELVDADALEPEFLHAVGHIRFRGVAARIALLLEGPPPFETLCLAPGLEYLERAYDAAKYGRVSERPWIEARAAGRDPAGRHRVMVHVQYAPYRLRDGGWDQARREALGDLAVGLLGERAPELPPRIVGREVSTPADLEARYGLTEGSWDHGELGLDQILFMRPVPGWAHYRTPVRGLYLCGAGAHPGGGILGGPGRLAAQTALREG
ncbi:MAG TPA: NAD(P)/FAD-dependent oxidoreductase, partial [Gemmatimonadales bacterium]|nr:NAD(P)/FAD-dependent oxidoreductase [Gemmatimonadales bacterium]